MGVFWCGGICEGPDVCQSSGKTQTSDPACWLVTGQGDAKGTYFHGEIRNRHAPTWLVKWWTVNLNQCWFALCVQMTRNQLIYFYVIYCNNSKIKTWYIWRHINVYLLLFMYMLHWPSPVDVACDIRVANSYLKRLGQAKIFNSVILFWLLNMTILCEHVHRLNCKTFF